MGEFMKKNEAIAIFCLLLMILIVFTLCSSIYLSKKQVNKNIILATSQQQNVDGGSTKSYTLTQEQVEEELKKLKKPPTYDELVKLAKDKYGMSEEVFQVAFGWQLNEGYDNDDHYLGYLCGSVGLNHYMGLGKTTPEALAASIAGADHRPIYYASSLQGKAINAKNHPESNVDFFNGMYLVLTFPADNAHDCDGVSDYSGLGGKIIYSSVNEGYKINIWENWFDGFKHWNADGKYTSSSGSVLGGGKDTGTVVLEKIDPRVDYADLCKSGGFRRASKIAGIIILVAKWLAPLILIIVGMTDFIKALVSNEEDSLGKATKTFIIRMVIAIITPFIPGLLYYLADYLIGDLKDENGELVSCTECLSNPFSCEIKKDE